MSEPEPARPRGDLLSDLEFAAGVGADPGGGTSRFAWTEELEQVIAWVSDELEGLGLAVQRDAAGNMIARWAGAGPAVMVASHLDTVRRGGRFDGVLGVLSAVEAIRILRRQGFEPTRPIWVGSFMDEEGTRFGTALFGSRAFCGEDLSAALTATDEQGVTVAEAMAERGFDPARIGEADRVSEVGRYLELHIEQGPVLEARGRALGLVEAISGVVGLRVTLTGETNHAGTTPLDMRRDAAVAAARAVLALREQALAPGGLPATVGQIRSEPGGRNVVPGLCRFSIDLRPRNPESFATFLEQVGAIVGDAASAERVDATIETEYALAPTVMAPDPMTALEEACLEQGEAPLRMASGAGHDAMVVGRHAEAAMLFVPSRAGISHAPEEWTAPEECELGARVLAGALARLAA